MAARCSRSGPRCGGRINARTRHAGVPGTGRMTVRGRLGAISGTSSLSAAATRRQWLAGATVPPPGLPTGTLRRPKGLIAVFAQWKIDWHSNCSVATIDLRFVACSASTAMPLRTSLSASRVQAWNVLDVLPVRRSGRCRTHGAAGEASTVQNHQAGVLPRAAAVGRAASDLHRKRRVDAAESGASAAHLHTTTLAGTNGETRGISAFHPCRALWKVHQQQFGLFSRSENRLRPVTEKDACRIA